MNYRKKIPWLAVACIVMLTLACISCRKQAPFQPPYHQSPAAARFTTAPATAPAIVQEMTVVLNREEAARPFLDSIVNGEGLAQWQYAGIKAPQGGDTLVTIPLIKDNQQFVNSILVAIKRQGRFRFTLINGNEYYKYGFTKGIQSFNASFAVLQLMAFNYQVFGDSLFAVNDRRLFDGSRYIRYKPKHATQARNRLFMITTEDCQTVVHDGNQGQLVGADPGETPDYPYGEETTCITITTFIEIGGGSGAGSPGNGWLQGGSSGSGGSGGANGGFISQSPGSGPFYPPICSQCIPSEPAAPIELTPDFKPIQPIIIDDSYTVTGPKHPVDIAAELNCFTNNPDAVYKISININQPVPNDRDLINKSAEFIVGHAFLTLEQINSPTDIKIRNVGFYPRTMAKPGAETDVSIFNDDSLTPTCVTLTMTVTAGEFQHVREFLERAVTMPYHLAFNNCTVVALDALSSISVQLPRTFGNLMLFSGINPGDLGQDIRELDLAALSRNSNGKVFNRSVSNINTVSAPPRQGQ